LAFLANVTQLQQTLLTERSRKVRQHNVFGGGVTVKRLLLAGFAMSALVAPAIAADMPVPAPAATWTGFYIGANGGYAASADNTVNSVGLPGRCSALLDVGCLQIPGFGPNNA
jgi:hypothetical protein